MPTEPLPAMISGKPRRFNTDHLVVQEQVIRDAIQTFEVMISAAAQADPKTPADPRLIDIVRTLDLAQNKAADFLEGLPYVEPHKPGASEAFYEAYTAFEDACRNVECALPHQMTEAITKQIEARAKLNSIVYSFHNPFVT